MLFTLLVDPFAPCVPIIPCVPVAPWTDEFVIANITLWLFGNPVVPVPELDTKVTGNTQ